jgi:pyruvate formate lyase activating enzyme
VNKIVSMSRLSEANPDGCFWPVIFIGGCNLRCPYCINSNSIVEPKGKSQSISIDQVIEQLDVWGEDGVMISGGEPLTPTGDEHISDLLSRLMIGGRKIGISTNGTWPHVLHKLIQDRLISFVALDCKFNPMLSTDRSATKVKLLDGYLLLAKDILLSLNVVSDWHENYPEAANSEIRVTLYPGLVDVADIASIASKVHKKSRLMLQQYRKNTCFNGQTNSTEPYSTDYVQHLFEFAKINCDAPVGIRWP